MNSQVTVFHLFQNIERSRWRVSGNKFLHPKLVRFPLPSLGEDFRCSKEYWRTNSHLSTLTDQGTRKKIRCYSGTTRYSYGSEFLKGSNFNSNVKRIKCQKTSDEGFRLVP